MVGMEITNYRDYRHFLKDELEARISKNSGYSLRAFARDLKITPQILSSVMKGKKSISIEVAAIMSDRLGFNPTEASLFIDLVIYAHSKNSTTKKILEFRINEKLAVNSDYKTLNIEAFKAISDWYHYAILELTHTKKFKSNSQWIAARLGISTHEVEQAVHRLKLLELIEENSSGQLTRTDVNVSAIFGVPSAALRKFNRQLLEKAAESLEEQSIEERDITTITMAIDPERLTEAKKMIAQFRRKICQFLEQGNRTEVYSFVPALFRLSKNKELI
jgi:uncharacterized protein (TIGR02147 family)